MPPLNARTTGPTLLPPAVLQATARQVISHRSRAFAELLDRVSRKLAPVAAASHAPLLLTASGTGGLEAACANFIQAGARVLLLTAGTYGDLFGRIAQRFGAQLDTLRFEPGTCADPDRLSQALRATDYDAVLVTHSESSTGVLNPLREIAASVRRHSRALLLVDAVSSLGVAPVEFDAWGIDVLVAGSQKGLMAPPGLSIVYLGETARQRLAMQRAASHYFDLAQALERANAHATPFTPAVNLVYGLDAALDLLHAEGLDTVLQRHQQAAQVCQEGLRAAGLRLFAREDCRGPAITSVCVPEGVVSTRVQAHLEQVENIVVSVGLDSWASRVLRVGHMGWMTVEQVADAARRIGALDWDALRAPVAEAA